MQQPEMTDAPEMIPQPDGPFPDVAPQPVPDMVLVPPLRGTAVE